VVAGDQTSRQDRHNRHRGWLMDLTVRVACTRVPTQLVESLILAQDQRWRRA
jgi:hypothetical protein